MENNTTVVASEVVLLPDYTGLHYENSLLLQIVVLGFFAAFGIAGNAVILVTGLRRVLTNFRGSDFSKRQNYKPALIMNLAVADILILVYGVPFLFMQETKVHLSDFVCRFLSPLRDALALTSILTIMAISVERAIAVISPFALETTHRHTRYGIASIWITAYLLVGLPMAFVMDSSEGDHQCYPMWKNRKLQLVHQTSAALLIVVPGLVTTFCYVFCLRALHRFRQRRQTSSNSPSIERERLTFVEQTRSVSRIAVVLVVVYWLCNLPMVTFAICIQYNLIRLDVHVLFYARAILVCLFFGASIINPIVLIAMSPVYRRSARGCLRYLFSKVNAIIRYSQRSRSNYTSDTTNRLEPSSGANEFALANRQN